MARPKLLAHCSSSSCMLISCCLAQPSAHLSCPGMAPTSAAAAAPAAAEGAGEQEPAAAGAGAEPLLFPELELVVEPEGEDEADGAGDEKLRELMQQYAARAEEVRCCLRYHTLPVCGVVKGHIAAPSANEWPVSLRLPLSTFNPSLLPGAGRRGSTLRRSCRVRWWTRWRRGSARSSATLQPSLRG